MITPSRVAVSAQLLTLWRIRRSIFSGIREGISSGCCPAARVLGWTFRISSGVSEGIYKSVVQGDREFLNVGGGGRR